MTKHFSYILMAFAVVSCVKDEITESVGGTPQSTTITVELPLTKVAVDESNGKCMWDESDCIAVYDAATSRYVEFTLSQGAGERRATFTSKEGIKVVNGADMVYPSAYAYDYMGNGEVVMKFPNIHENGSKVPVVLKGKVTMDNNDSYSGTFSHLSGVIKFTLHDVPAYAAGFVLKSEINSLAGLFVDGSLSQSYVSKAIKVTFPYKTGYNYSTSNDGADDPDDAVIYVPLPEGTYSDLKVYLIDGDGDVIEGTQKKMKPAELSAGDYVIMPVLDLKKSELRKDFVKVCGVKWAKGNLVCDKSSAWQTRQTGVDDGFQDGWGLHDEQWKYINWDQSISVSGVSDLRYTQNNTTLFDVFSWGGIGRQASYHSGRLVPSTANFDISQKVFWGYVNTDSKKSNPENLELLEGDARFSSELASNGNSQYTKDGKTQGIAGDIAFWASKGKYCMPKKVLLQELSHPSSSKASFQYGKYIHEEKVIYGYLYTTPQGDVVRNNKEVEFTAADIESGLFLPFAGRRSNTNNTTVILQGQTAFYRSSTFGTPTNVTYGDHSQCATSLWFEGDALPKYGFTAGAKTDETSNYSFTCTAGNAAGGSIRPVLVDDTVVNGDVEELIPGPFDAKVGEPLPKWNKGCLDIHAINSGRGECTFFIMPDGTTLCVDAGEIAPAGGTHPRVDPKPDADTRAYMVYANYVKHYLPYNKTSMDYMLMTHFHNDHFGTSTSAYSKVTRGGYTYYMSGIMALYDEVPFDKIIDRSFDADDLTYSSVPETSEDANGGYGYYAQFVSWARSAKGLAAEKVKNGSLLPMTNNPSAYPEFKIQINAVDCYYWNGSKSVDAYALKRLLGKVPAENANSISFLLSYGEFDYLTSGDAGTNSDVALPLAKSINRKIEAMKAHHHFSWRTMDKTMMAIYQPKVVVSQSFYDHQPDMGHSWLCDEVDYSDKTNMEFQQAWNSYSSEKHWFFTNIHNTISDTYPDEVAKIAGKNGHVVIRVAEGGEQFYVYVLDDTDFEYKVIQIHGPYTCH